MNSTTIKLMEILKNVKKNKLLNELNCSSEFNDLDIKMGPKFYNNFQIMNIKPENYYGNLDYYHLHFVKNDVYHDYFVDEKHPNKVVLVIRYKFVNGYFMCYSIIKLDGYPINPLNIMFEFYFSKYDKIKFDQTLTRRGLSFWVSVIEEMLKLNYNIYFDIFININNITNKTKKDNLPPKEFLPGIHKMNNFLKNKNHEEIKNMLDDEESIKKNFKIYDVYIEK